jgi:hypothetical protein
MLFKVLKADGRKRNGGAEGDARRQMRDAFAIHRIVLVLRLFMQGLVARLGGCKPETSP